MTWTASKASHHILHLYLIYVRSPESERELLEQDLLDNVRISSFWSIASLGAPGFVLQKMELGPGLQDNSLMEMESTQINACRQKLDVMTPPSRTHD